MKASEVLYFFRGARRERVESSNDFPHDHFYGVLEWPADAGFHAEFIDQIELPQPAVDRWRVRAGQWLWFTLFRLKLDHIVWFGRRENLAFLNQFKAIVVVTLSQGLALSYLKKRGKIQGNVHYIITGLENLKPHALAKKALRWVLGQSALASLSYGEIEALRKDVLRNREIGYVPFGVDHRFWSIGDTTPTDDYILSVGNDIHRDYALLVDQWQPDWPKLKILTSQGLPQPLPANVEALSGDYAGGGITDEALRELYQNCMMVVIPLDYSNQPSGQSVALQAMACGKTVLLADTPGLWDRNAIRHEVNCLLYKAEDVVSFREAMVKLLGDEPLRTTLGANARAAVESHFTCEHTAQGVSGWVAQVMGMNHGKEA